MVYNSIEEVFEAFKKLKVLIIGDVMIDAYIYGSAERISPEAPVPVVRVKRKEKRLGGAANVALNIQALGAEPILCSVIGDDEDGKKFVKLLQKQNISSKGIIQSGNRITTIKHRVLAGSQQMLRIDEESDNSLNTIEENTLIDHITNLLKEVDLVIFEDYDKGTLNKRVISETIKLANDQGKPTIVDPKKKNFKHYSNSTLFKPNLKELNDGLKTEVDPTSQVSLDKTIESFMEKYGHRNVMITLSEKGIYIKGSSKSHIIPAHLRKIADVSGAGDTVVSIAGLCLALGLSDNLIAELANLGGGLVCEYLGVVPIDKERFIKESSALRLS
ncbi:bifunctional ADP-heptose synthase [Reichenbachiella sp. MALMAid0571]|uniref:bifunctional heptose 7-phosphate kinase/heptose 1-phosphate adenyltransferase n=1 Tax=Reichenbachiella sp. MALMAid0571 TaxID=3143939 RepID=UPI0032DE7705